MKYTIDAAFPPLALDELNQLLADAFELHPITEATAPMLTWAGAGRVVEEMTKQGFELRLMQVQAEVSGGRADGMQLPTLWQANFYARGSKREQFPFGALSNLAFAAISLAAAKMLLYVAEGGEL